MMNRITHKNTERLRIFLKLVHTTDLKVPHLYISIVVVSSMNPTAVNKNTANRIVGASSLNI
jgi:hypothetical protein